MSYAQNNRNFPGWTGYFLKKNFGQFEGKIKLAHHKEDLLAIFMANDTLAS